MKRLVDFEKLAKIHGEDPSRRSLDNLVEQTWIPTEEGRKHLQDASLDEILFWFKTKFPWITLELKNASEHEHPTAAMKSGLFQELVHLIGWHWNKILLNPYMDSRFYEIEDLEEMDVEQRKVTLH